MEVQAHVAHGDLHRPVGRHVEPNRAERQLDFLYLNVGITGRGQRRAIQLTKQPPKIRKVFFAYARQGIRVSLAFCQSAVATRSLRRTFEQYKPFPLTLNLPLPHVERLVCLGHYDSNSAARFTM
jgi:hypothetical protein